MEVVVVAVVVVVVVVVVVSSSVDVHLTALSVHARRTFCRRY